MRIIQRTAPYSTTDLRVGLIADLEALREGRLGGAEARTRAYVAKQIIDSMKLEIVAAHMKLEEFEPVKLLEAA